MAERWWKRCLGIATALVVVAVPYARLSPADAGPTPQPLTANFSGTNGVGRIVDPGRRCADGGSGQYRHISLETAANPVLSAGLPGFFRATLDVHHDGDEPVGTPLVGPAAKAFLQPGESHGTFSNQRGSVPLLLNAGNCGAPPLTFDGAKISGSGVWTIDALHATGAYRQSTGTGTFTLANTGVEPGADNPWSLQLNGNISVLQPSYGLEVVSVSWGNLGVDYLLRKVTVEYRVRNNGPGDAFGVVMQATSTTTPGVTPLGPQPQNLGDLLAGEYTTFKVRYQFTLLAGPCKLIILGCEFDTYVSVSMPDALDKADVPTPTRGAHVTAPNFPPPL